MLTPEQLATTRVKVACINWSAIDACKAMTYLLVQDGTAIGEAAGERFFDTWAEAVDWSRELDGMIRRALERAGVTQEVTC